MERRLPFFYEILIKRCYYFLMKIGRRAKMCVWSERTMFSETREAISRPKTSRTVLVIEDEAALSEILREELTRLGYKAYLARDGLEGLEKIQQVEPDLIICDRIMPSMSGSELLTRLRGVYPQYADVPFIFLSAMTDPHNKAEVRGLNPFAYLEKPLDFDRLQKIMEQALNTP